MTYTQGNKSVNWKKKKTKSINSDLKKVEVVEFADKDAKRVIINDLNIIKDVKQK